jgi:hypothetical protein
MNMAWKSTSSGKQPSHNPKSANIPESVENSAPIPKNEHMSKHGLELNIATVKSQPPATKRAKVIMHMPGKLNAEPTHQHSG